MDYLTIKKAAAMLGLSRRGLQERITRGDVRAQRMGDRLWVIPVEEVERQRNFGRQRPGRKPGAPWKRVRSEDGQGGPA